MRAVDARALIGLALSTGSLFLDAPGVAQPTAEKALERQVLTLFERGETEQVEAILAEASERHPDSPQLLAWLGTARYLNRKYLTAEEPLRRAVDLGQNDLGTRYYLASTLWENGRLEEAKASCREAMSSHGEQLPLVHLLGRLELWQGHFEEAAEWLAIAVAMSPGSLDLWLDLAGARGGADQVEEALNAYRRAVELAPEHYQVRYGLARMLDKAGDAQGAARELAVYRRLLEEDQARTQREGLERSQIDLGYEFLRQGRVEAAIAHLETLAPGVEVWVARSRAYEAAGDARAALAALEQAVALAPGRRDLRDRLVAARLVESRE